MVVQIYFLVLVRQRDTFYRMVDGFEVKVATVPGARRMTHDAWRMADNGWCADRVCEVKMMDAWQKLVDGRWVDDGLVEGVYSLYTCTCGMRD